MILLQFGRAGSEKLKEFFRQKMEELRVGNEKVESKIGTFDEIDSLSKSQFYSSWKYALVHVVLSASRENQIEQIKMQTGLSQSEILNIISFLLRIGLISKKGGIYQPTKKRIHLTRDDTLISVHHKNFRQLSIKNLEDMKSDSLYYSAAIALSKDDAEKIRRMMLEIIKRSEEILRPSQEETVRILNIDFFASG